MDVVSFGSVNIDRVVRVDEATIAELTAHHQPFPRSGETLRVDALPPLAEHSPTISHGGKGANQALAAARAGVETTMLGKVGADEADYGVLDNLRAGGVDVTDVEVTDGHTGTAGVFVTPTGESHIAIVPGANGQVDPAYAHEHLEQVRTADVLLVQNELPAAALDALLLALDGQASRPTVVFDPAPAAGAADLLVHPCIDIVIPNEAEYDALGSVLSGWPGTVVRTRGDRPVLLEGEPVPVPEVEPVDTTGAGDVFAGALAARLAMGDERRSAVRWAATAASLSTTHHGAQAGIPDRAAVEATLANWNR